MKSTLLHENRLGAQIPPEVLLPIGPLNEIFTFQVLHSLKTENQNNLAMIMIMIIIDNTENDRKKVYVSNDMVFKIVLPRMPLLSSRYFRYAFA